MLTNIAQYLLKIGHITFILRVTVFGVILDDTRQDRYLKAAAFLFWVMIFNTLLKNLFKVPLMPHLGNGFAFPSGHMHASCAFYGFLMYETKDNATRAVLAILLTMLGFSLIACHYHDLIDVLGAVAFFGLELFSFHQLKKHFSKLVGLVVVLSAVLTLVYLAFLNKLAFHVWLAFWGLIGYLLTLKYVPKVILKPKWLGAVLAIALTAAGFKIVLELFNYLNFKEYYLSEIRAGLMPLVVVSAKLIASRFAEKLNNKF